MFEMGVLVPDTGVLDPAAGVLEPEIGVLEPEIGVLVPVADVGSVGDVIFVDDLPRVPGLVSVAGSSGPIRGVPYTETP
jgi:hypothetical protein